MQNFASDNELCESQNMRRCLPTALVVAALGMPLATPALATPALATPALATSTVAVLPHNHLTTLAPTGHGAQPRILSAAWGLNDGASCPTGETGLDNIPVTLSWYINPLTVTNAEFTFTRSDGSKVQPTCSLVYPPNEANELQTLNLVGDFGDPAGVRPVRVTIGKGLSGKPIGTQSWTVIHGGLKHWVTRLEAGPFISDAWVIAPAQLVGDTNQCPSESISVRVVWSNGMTAFPSGAEIGPAVTASYRAVFLTPRGKLIPIAPTSVADLNDHATPAMDDNMHDLCLSGVPRGARLKAVTVGANLLQDPNGDPNPVQRFLVRRPLIR